ncbi:MAG: alpha/beta fold hydrolase [Pseudomonadota bacterium]
MPEIDLNGITMHYEVGGSGPPLILLAGMLSDNASWGPLVEPLAQNHTVIRPDNRTTGRTTPWDAPVSVGQMAEDAAALMQALGHTDYHVIGHSMGGLMAMELAGLADLASLTILCSAPVRVPRTMAMFDTLTAIRAEPNGEELWLRALYPWAFQPTFFADPINIETALKAARAYPYAQTLPAMRHQIEALRTFKPRTRPADIKAPTQVVFAEHDLMIPEAAGRAAFAAIPNVTMHTVPDAGHSIHWDNPAAVLELILAHTGDTT